MDEEEKVKNFCNLDKRTTFLSSFLNFVRNRKKITLANSIKLKISRSTSKKTERRVLFKLKSRPEVRDARKPLPKNN